MKIQEIHDCEKCRGKIVCIRVDNRGNTYCGYCNERVDYRRMKNKKYQDFLKEMGINKK